MSRLPLRLGAAAMACALVGVALAALAPIAAAAVQEHETPQGDAPGSSALAADVPFGPIAGVLDPDLGDEADWYRIPVVTGHVLSWNYSTGVDETTVYLLSDNGQWIEAVNVWAWFGNGTISTRHVVMPSDHVRIGVERGETGGDYLLQFALTPRADVSVDAIEVERAAGPLDVVMPTTLERTVRVHVSNQGLAATTSHVRTTVHATSLSSTRHLGTIEVLLLPGEQRVLEYAWHGAGQVGEATVVVEATSSWIQTRTDNDRLEASSHVLVDHAGVGVDALNGGAVAAGWYSDGRSTAGVCATVCVGASDPVGDSVDPLGDANGGLFAVSPTGNATADGVAVSGTGGASGAAAASGTGRASGGAAASGTGEAEGALAGATLAGAATCEDPEAICFTFGALGSCEGGRCNDVQPTGNASARSIAVSGTGDSEAPIAVALFGDARGDVAVSAGGDADGMVAVAGLGDARGLLAAVSGAGDADSELVAGSVGGDARGGQAVSGLGDATCTFFDCVALAPMGNATAVCDNIFNIEGEECRAVTVLGHARCEPGPGAFGHRCTATRLTDAPTLPDVRVEPTDDAEGGDVAVSGTGDAHTKDGASVSVLGDASNGDDADWSCSQTALGGARCVAVSGAGNARNGGDGMGSCEIAPLLVVTVAATCIAVSGAGDASNGGDGAGACALYGSGGVTCIAIAPRGSARNGGSGFMSCAAMLSSGSVTCVAVSGAGDAANAPGSSWGCYAYSGTDAPGITCVALSVLGSASNAEGEYGCPGTDEPLACLTFGRPV